MISQYCQEQLNEVFTLDAVSHIPFVKVLFGLQLFWIGYRILGKFGELIRFEYLAKELKFGRFIDQPIDY